MGRTAHDEDEGQPDTGDEEENYLEHPFPQQLGVTDDDDGAGEGISAGEGDDTGEGEGDGTGGDGLSVTEQMDALQKKLDAQEEQNRQLQQLVMTSQFRGQQGAPQQEEANDFSLDDLPDPVENPDEFKKQLSERLTKNIQHTNQTATQQAQRASQLDALTQKFNTKYPDLASREALFMGATSAEANRLRAHGVKDVQSAVLADPDGFMERVANRMKTELGTDSGKGKETGSRTRPGAGKRTQGVSGGSRKPAGDKASKSPLGFQQQLKQTQLKDGLI